MIDPQESNSSLGTASLSEIKIVQLCPQCNIEVAGMNVCPNDGTRVVPEYLTGSSIAQRYEIIESVGTGGMSVIFKAKHPLLERIVAVKMLHMHLVLDFNSLKRFQHEAQAVSKLSHPNIIVVHDFGILSHGQPFMVMDYVDGGSFADLIERNGRIDCAQALTYFRQACSALAYAHSKGILHRDLKPSNIMFDLDDAQARSVRIVDFGIAQINADEQADSRLTRTGEIVGTPLYMSPEQCRGLRVDARSDVYSMGCVMYEALSGKPPHMGSNLLETIYKHLNSDLQPLATLGLGDDPLLDRLDSVIIKCLRKNPARRFQTMAELVSALENSSAAPRPVPGRVPGNLLKVGVIIVSCAVLALAAMWIGGAISQRGDLPVGSLQTPIKRTGQYPVPGPRFNPDNGRMFSPDEWIRWLVQNRKPAGFISLDGTSLSDKGMRWMSRLPDLQTLIVSHTQITDRGVQALQHLPMLQKLDVGSNNVTDKGVEAISHIKTLQQLYLSRTNISDAAIDLIRNLPQLHELALNGTRLTDAGLAQLGEIKSLRSLNLSCMQMAPGSIASVGKLPKLDCLNLYSCGITKDHLRALKGSSIVELDISRNTLDDAALHQLSGISHLRFLALNYCGLTDAQIAIITALPLQSLRIEGCPIDDIGLKQLCSMKQLDGLSLCNISSISAHGFSVLAELPKISTLFFDSTSIDDQALNAICKNQCIKELHLDDTNVTDAGMAALAGLPNLQLLSISHTKISDKGLSYLTGLKQLKVLSVEETNVTEQGLLSLLNIASLKSLHISRGILSDDGGHKLRHLLPL